HCCYCYYVFMLTFFFHYPATTEIYTLSLHDALPIYWNSVLRDHVLELEWLPAVRIDHRRARPGHDERRVDRRVVRVGIAVGLIRSEEHTSELQSRVDLVCRLLLEKKKKVE